MKLQLRSVIRALGVRISDPIATSSSDKPRRATAPSSAQWWQSLWPFAPEQPSIDRPVERPSASEGHLLVRDLDPAGRPRTRVIPKTSAQPASAAAAELPADYYDFDPGEHPTDLPAREPDRWDTESIERPATFRPGTMVEVTRFEEFRTTAGLVRSRDGSGQELALGRRSKLRERPGLAVVPGYEVPYGGLPLPERFYQAPSPRTIQLGEGDDAAKLELNAIESERYPKPKRELKRATAARRFRKGALIAVGTAAAAAVMAGTLDNTGQAPSEAPAAQPERGSAAQLDSRIDPGVGSVAAGEQSTPMEVGPSSWSSFPGDESLRYTVDYDSRGGIQVRLCQAGDGESVIAKAAQTRLTETKPSVAMSFVQLDQPWTELDKNGVPGTPLGDCGVAAWSPAALAAVPNANAPRVHTVGITIGRGEGSRFIAVDTATGAVTAADQRSGQQQVTRAPVKKAHAGGKHRQGPKHRLHN